MTWTDFYLICFVLGIIFSVVSVLGGGSRWHLHVPHGHLVPHAHSSLSSAFNFVTFTAFLAWFGGAGYLLSRYSSLWFLIGLAISTAAGLVGAAIVFGFLSRVLTSDDENLDPADFEMNGVLGRVSVPLRPGGTGEIIYSQQGTRRTCGARSETGAIAKGSEVVVTHYDKGIAYVRLWSEMSGDSDNVGGEALQQEKGQTQ